MNIDNIVRFFLNDPEKNIPIFPFMEDKYFYLRSKDNRKLLLYLKLEDYTFTNAVIKDRAEIISGMTADEEEVLYKELSFDLLKEDKVICRVKIILSSDQLENLDDLVLA